MHLKTAVKCRSVLLAAGLLHDEPQVPARSWKKVRAEYSVLCPPQKTQPALNVQPVADVRWAEVPGLQILFQEALDWLVWIETADIDAVRQGLLKIFSSYTLYDSEFRQVAGKLLLSAKELLVEEELRIWTAVGPDLVLNLLADFSEHFRGTVFLTSSPEGCAVERVDMRTVLSAEVWKADTMVRTAKCSSLPILRISSMLPLRPTSNRQVLTPIEAMREWHASGWKHFSSVEVSLKKAVDPLAFFGARLSMQAATEPQHVTIFLLRHLASYLSHGGTVRLDASSEFWRSSIAFPFFGARSFVSL